MLLTKSWQPCGHSEAILDDWLVSAGIIKVLELFTYLFLLSIAKYTKISPLQQEIYWWIEEWIICMLYKTWTRAEWMWSFTWWGSAMSSIATYTTWLVLLLFSLKMVILVEICISTSIEFCQNVPVPLYVGSLYQKGFSACVNFFLNHSDLLHGNHLEWNGTHDA